VEIQVLPLVELVDRVFSLTLQALQFKEQVVVQALVASQEGQAVREAVVTVDLVVLVCLHREQH
jgi:hypothetical protein